ncbi:GNAT family N-acetyltransferase [Massilia sp. W12]|uniref:GNAT family N-acetyltransferase n=1 Tax=Massilia sp. W12 TaxID=3126507 RepID=UPI0030D0ADD5
MTGCRLQIAQAADLPELFEMRCAALASASQSPSLPVSPASLQRAFAAGFVAGEWWLVLRPDGQRIGWLAWHDQARERHLQHFYLLPAWQSQGIGGRLLHQLCAEAGRRGLDVVLSVLHGSRAGAFYRRAGFIQDGGAPGETWYRFTAHSAAPL